MVLLAAIPSSSVALVVARSITSGTLSGIAVAIGIVIGDLLFVVIAMIGLAAVDGFLTSLSVFIKPAGGLYLIWLSYQLFTADSMVTVPGKDQSRRGEVLKSAMAGLFLTLGDVKAILFYVSFFPVFVNLSSISVSEVMTIMLITIVGVGGVKIAYAVFANKLATILVRSSFSRFLRKIMAASLAAAGSTLVFQSAVILH